MMMEARTDSPLFAHRHWAEITALYVAPERRGQAVSDALVAAGARWARERGFTRIQLFVTSSNVLAKRFYQRVGFAPIQEIWSAPLDAAAADVIGDAA
jgi:ribosomal protein S18 acetylase RimI-like enzyme